MRELPGLDMDHRERFGAEPMTSTETIAKPTISPRDQAIKIATLACTSLVAFLLTICLAIATALHGTSVILVFLSALATAVPAWGAIVLFLTEETKNAGHG